MIFIIINFDSLHFTIFLVLKYIFFTINNYYSEPFTTTSAPPVPLVSATTHSSLYTLPQWWLLGEF